MFKKIKNSKKDDKKGLLELKKMSKEDSRDASDDRPEAKKLKIGHH